MQASIALLRAAAILLLPALSIHGCTWGAVDPTILSVTPSEAPNDLDVELVISGRDFDPLEKIAFDDPGRSGPGFSVALLSGGTRVELDRIQGRSTGALQATLHAGAPVGTYDVEVRDPRGRGATLPASFRVFDAVRVTTATDEADPGATPIAPGGAGLSLREAVTWVNGQGTAKTIMVGAALGVLTTPNAFTLLAPGAAIVAEQGVVVDFGGINKTCVTLGGPGERLVGVTLRNCGGTFLSLAAGSGGSTVAHVTFVAGAARYWSDGIVAGASSGSSRIGPGNELSGLYNALRVDGAGYEIFGNSFYDNSLGVRLAGVQARLWQNTFARHVAGPSNKGTGISVLAGPGPVEILHSVFDQNAVDGVAAGAVSSLTVRDNLFTGNGALGLNALAAGLVLDHNGYFGNASGPVAAGLSTGPTDLFVDPLYVDAGGRDFRLQAGSPAIDAGIDTGLDVNGGAPGLFDGLAPDLGAFESP